MALDYRQLITRARIKANQRTEVDGDGFLSDEEVLLLLNPYYIALFNKLVSLDENYFVKEYSFTMPQNQEGLKVNEIMLPADFYKVKLLTRKYSGLTSQRLDKISFAQRTEYDNANVFFPLRQSRDDGKTWQAYIIQGSRKLSIHPERQSQGEYNIVYIPQAIDVKTDNHEFPPGYDELIVINTAMAMVTPEEGDVKNLMKEKEDWMKKVETWASDRDEGSPQSIAEVLDYDGEQKDNLDYWRDF